MRIPKVLRAILWIAAVLFVITRPVTKLDILVAIGLLALWLSGRTTKAPQVPPQGEKVS